MKKSKVLKIILDRKQVKNYIVIHQHDHTDTIITRSQETAAGLSCSHANGKIMENCKYQIPNQCFTGMAHGRDTKFQTAKIAEKKIVALKKRGIPIIGRTEHIAAFIADAPPVLQGILNFEQGDNFLFVDANGVFLYRTV